MIHEAPERPAHPDLPEFGCSTLHAPPPPPHLRAPLQEDEGWRAEGWRAVRRQAQGWEEQPQEVPDLGKLGRKARPQGALASSSHPLQLSPSGWRLVQVLQDATARAGVW